jgi:hypothetical protein
MTNDITKEVIEEVQSIENKKGQITPDQVIEAAKNESSVLHKFFVWDDSEAATLYRRDQARDLIRRVKVEVPTVHYPMNVVRYVHDPTATPDVSLYQNILRIPPKSKISVVKDEVARIKGNLERTIPIVIAMNGNIPPTVLTNLEKSLDLMNQIMTIEE